MPEELIRVTEFERSFSTKLGTTFEEVAKLIGRDNYCNAERSYSIRGEVSTDAIRIIESIINEIGTNGMNASYPDLVSQVVNAPVREERRRRKIADLYLADTNGNEMFFEIKSPKPNKGQCLEATDRLLQIHAIKRRGPPQVRTYYAMAYNPWGVEKESYTHSFTRRYMDMETQVLIGKEFWDLIGGEGTYGEVLEIYREVGREKGPDMIDQLALGY